MESKAKLKASANLSWVLEVVRFLSKEERIAKKAWAEHVGYMNITFKAQQKACDYYDKHNPHMRALNAHGTFRSDWDPETYLLYIVREDHDILALIPPFQEN